MSQESKDWFKNLEHMYQILIDGLPNIDECVHVFKVLSDQVKYKIDKLL